MGGNVVGGQVVGNDELLINGGTFGGGNTKGELTREMMKQMGNAVDWTTDEFGSDGN